jgi:hypothetical protein
MSVAETIRMAEASGIRLGVEGADLILDADLEPPVDVVNAICRHKAEIIELLALSGDRWTADDWQALYDERAAIAEYERGASREVAEATAFEVCVVRWLDSHPPSQDDLDCCVHCGEQMDELDAISYLTGDGGDVWMHGQCHPAWTERRRKQAVEALAGLGLSLACTGAAQ